MAGAAAGIGRRLGAFCYDCLVVAALLIAAAGVVLLVSGGTAVPAGTRWFQVFLLLIIGVYFCWSWWRRGQTLGMLAWRIVIRNTDGAPITLPQSLGRFVAGTLFFGIGFVWSLLDRRGRSGYDILSGTRLVRLESLANPAQRN